MEKKEKPKIKMAKPIEGKKPKVRTEEEHTFDFRAYNKNDKEKP